MPGPTPLSSLLGDLNVIRWIRAWKECAGPALIKQARFLGVHGARGKKELRLEVRDPVWRQELQYEAESLLRRYRETAAAFHVPAEDLPVTVRILGSVGGGTTDERRLPTQNGKPVKPPVRRRD